MPTPASAAIVAMATCGPSRCTAAVAARTRASGLRAASLRGSRGRGFIAVAMRSLKPSPVVSGNGYNETDEILRIERTRVRTLAGGLLAGLAQQGNTRQFAMRQHAQPARSRPA